MKTSFWLLAVLAGCVARVNADGVCYDPDHVGVGSKNENTVRADMELIKAKGFSHVRTYISKFGNTDMASIVAKSGLRAALGVPYPEGDYQSHAEAAIKAAQGGGVEYIFVGNENLFGLGNVPGSMIDLINYIKSKVPGGVKVGTVQASSEFARNVGGWSELVGACDSVGVNIHPFFHPNTDASNAIKETDSQWKSFVKNLGDKLVLTETGWPTDGSTAGNSGSVDGAAKYFQAYKAWSGIIPDNKKFYFQMFDQPHRYESYEKQFGILNSDSSEKFNAGGNGPVPTPAPSPTPPPSTATPTPSPSATPAPSNSTSSSHHSGSGSHAEAGVGEDTTILEGTDENGVLEMRSGDLNNEESTTNTADGDTAQAGEKQDEAVQANNQSAGGSSPVGIIFVAIFGCAAVFAAFGFIYKARQKAQELEDSESKDSVAMMTPGGGCVL